MNLERLAKLQETLEWLRDTPELPSGYRFHLSHWRVAECRTQTCQTYLCLAGWYVQRNPDCGLVFRGEQIDTITGSGYGTLSILAEHFDIDCIAVGRLFLPTEYPGLLSYYRRDQVLPVALERLQAVRRHGAISEQLMAEQEDRLTAAMGQGKNP